ncbi:MAG: hypothetical protein JNM81_05780 [Rhodospirillaceae bacterium]|nr:hypothetical protein [Rhodospirillaceae bacterium]
MTKNFKKTEYGPGLYGLPESPQQFQARITEINRLELLLKLHALTADERERLQRQVNLLKGANDNKRNLNKD